MNFIKYKNRRKATMLSLAIVSVVLAALVTGCYNNNTGETGILGIGKTGTNPMYLVIHLL